jgi:hypothetical protein
MQYQLNRHCLFQLRLGGITQILEMTGDLPFFFNQKIFEGIELFFFDGGHGFPYR